jgi:hypothetical protein
LVERDFSWGEKTDDEEKIAPADLCGKRLRSPTVREGATR